MSKIIWKYFLFFLILLPWVNAEEAEPLNKYDLVICAIFQNEEFFMKEWIEFHKLMGVQHFYLYDNDSTDQSVEILQPYIEAGEVDLFPWHFEAHTQPDHSNFVQFPAYGHALEIVKESAVWAAFIDIDEFLYPVEENNLVDLLKKYEEYAGLVANWQIYGTSNRETLNPHELITEALTLKAPTDVDSNKMVKSIVQPSLVTTISDAHSFFYAPGYYAVNSDGEPLQQGYPLHSSITIDKIRINHYWYGSRDWFLNNKVPRRVKWGVTSEPEELEAMMAGCNVEEDDSITRFAPDLRQAMFPSQ